MDSRTHLRSALLAGGMLLLGAAPALAAKPLQKPDESWVSLTGTIKAVAGDTFVLDYGPHSVVVDMDKGRLNHGRWMKPGQTVNVYGVIDKGFFNKPEIDATRVYSYDRNAYYYGGLHQVTVKASSLEPTRLSPPIQLPAPTAKNGSNVSVAGLVTRLGDDDFYLSTSAGSYDVKVGKLADNPLDDKGARKVRPGDYVYVTGPVDDGFFVAHEIKARNLVTLVDVSDIAKAR
ncbi:MAG: NirD/YgiW/YdeI family stress tolerance protein [Alphaproteobacteria bacterium]|nr:NirD/YgiW/YdeI family stress tolerance protein [Alphaproteobacteria bacterium]